MTPDEIKRLVAAHRADGSPCYQCDELCDALDAMLPVVEAAVQRQRAIQAHNTFAVQPIVRRLSDGIGIAEKVDNAEKLLASAVGAFLAGAESGKDVRSIIGAIIKARHGNAGWYFFENQFEDGDTVTEIRLYIPHFIGPRAAEEDAIEAAISDALGQDAANRLMVVII